MRYTSTFSPVSGKQVKRDTVTDVVDELMKKKAESGWLSYS